MKNWLRLLGCLIISTILSLSTLAALSSSAQHAGAAQSTLTNVAIGKPVTTVGTTCTADSPGSKLVDGLVGNSATTKWCASAGGPPWQATIDLGAVHNVDRIILFHAGSSADEWDGQLANTRDYTVYSSVDGSTYVQRVYEASNTQSGRTHIVSFQARYVQLNIAWGVQPGYTWGNAARVYEMEVYGVLASAPQTRPTLLHYDIQRLNPEYHLQSRSMPLLRYFARRCAAFGSVAGSAGG